MTKDFDRYDGSNQAVVRTEALGPEDLEHALRTAYEEWDWHKLVRPLKDFRHLKRVLSRPRATGHTFRHVVSRKARRRQDEHATSSTPGC